MSKFRKAISYAKTGARYTRSAAVKAAATAGKVERGAARAGESIDRFRSDMERSYAGTGRSAPTRKPAKKRKRASSGSGRDVRIIIQQGSGYRRPVRKKKPKPARTWNAVTGWD